MTIELIVTYKDGNQRVVDYEFLEQARSAMQRCADDKMVWNAAVYRGNECVEDLLAGVTPP